jgi:hypothetical protein
MALDECLLAILKSRGSTSKRGFPPEPWTARPSGACATSVFCSQNHYDSVRIDRRSSHHRTHSLLHVHAINSLNQGDTNWEHSPCRYIDAVPLCFRSACLRDAGAPLGGRPWSCYRIIYGTGIRVIGYTHTWLTDQPLHPLVMFVCYLRSLKSRPCVPPGATPGPLALAILSKAISFTHLFFCENKKLWATV